MAWFRNRYVCPDCRAVWEDEWSCSCEDECGTCGCRSVTPVASDDLTIVLDGLAEGAIAFRVSPSTADYDPAYREIIVRHDLDASAFGLDAWPYRP